MRKLISINLLLLISFGFVARVSPSPLQQQAPQTAEQYVQAGDRYSSERQFDKAVESYKLAINLDANLPRAYYGLGVAYMNMGRMPDAQEPMRTAVRLAPTNANAHRALGNILESLRHLDEALAELYEAKRLNPNEPAIQNDLGNIFLNTNRFDDALTAYSEARRLNPRIPYVHHNIGLTMIKQGRYAEAIAPFEEALKLDPRYRNARFFLADAYTKTRQYDKAIDSWSKFLELVPNGPDALQSRAWTYLYEGGHGKEAAADSRTFLDVYGWTNASSPYRVIVGYFGYREAAMNDEAQAMLDEATKKISNPRWPFAVIRYLSGELTEEKLFEQAVNNDQKTEAHAYVGLALSLNGKSEDARAHLEWVKQYGNKRFFEYPLAMEELARLK